MASTRSTKEQLGVEMADPIRPEAEEQPVASVDDRPEWLPEKFKDPSEFATSYKQLEDELRQRGEAQKRLENQVSALTDAIENLDTRPEPQLGPEQATDYREQLMAAYENDPLGTIAYLAQQYAVQTIDQRFEQMQQENRPAYQAQAEAQNQLLAMSVDRALSETYDDWDDYKERVAEEIMADNGLLPPSVLQSPEQTIRSLSRVYENLKARDVLAGQENGNFVNHQLTQMKRQAQTVTGNTTRPGEPSPEDEKFARLKAAAEGMSYSAWRG